MAMLPPDNTPPESYQLSITLDPATYAMLQAFGAQFAQGVANTAAALLAAELVRGSEAEHGPDLDGRIFTRGEVLHLALAAERSRTALLESQLATLRNEVRSVAVTIGRIVEEQGG